MGAGSGRDDFVWDDDDASGNVVHIWEHGVTPTVAEEAVLDPRARPAGERWVGGERRYTIIRATAARRILVVVFVIREDAIRAITAYPARDREKRRYRRRSLGQGWKDVICRDRTSGRHGTVGRVPGGWQSCEAGTMYLRT